MKKRPALSMFCSNLTVLQFYLCSFHYFQRFLLVFSRFMTLSIPNKIAIELNPYLNNINVPGQFYETPASDF